MVPSLLRCLVASALFMTPLALMACPGSDTTVQDQEHGPLCGDEFRLVQQLSLDYAKDVDILFVIDNSASMAQAQVKLNQGIGALFERLELAGANYRIAFTTTDNGNPWCPAGATTPEAGNFVLSSCKDRIDDFVFNNGEIDARDLACNEQCLLLNEDLEILPTTTDLSDTAAPRRWLELSEGVSNLPTTTDLVEAFRCFAPQGINGCGFESQLESMYLALIRSQNADEQDYGFLRPDALLAIVLLTDEADCSYNKSWAEIFEQDGNKEFWSDPAAAFPTSAVCWNAGVTCSGDPSNYDGCEPIDKDVSGVEGVSDDAAVLYPLSRYIGLLEGMEVQKQELDADNELLVTVIAGVEGAGEDWSVTYADTSDTDYQLAFGIGPGCTSADDQSAVPPVRMRALAEAMDPAGLYSICDADYSATLADLGDRITAQFGPVCYSKCVADADLSTPQLEPNCTLEEDPPGNENTQRMQLCERADGGYVIDPETQTYQLPAGVDLCYAMLVDRDGSDSADPNDDLSEICRDSGYNLEFEIVRRKGVARISGTAISVECELSSCVEDDCPGIGG